MSDLTAIEEIMTEVRRNWNIMLQDQFNPIMVALEILQNSNPSHDYDSFMRLHGQLDEAMATIVEKYYTGFNNAVSIFGGIVDNTNRTLFLFGCPIKLSIVSKSIVSKVKNEIEEFRDQIQFKRVEIPDLWSKVQQYKGTFAITDKLDHVQRQQTAALELSERKFFIPAARTLMGAIYDCRYLHSSNLIPTAELLKILEGNRDNMFDLIVDEIHTLIYLKDDRASPQLFSRLVEKIPEAKSLAVGSMKLSSEIAINISDVDLVLAPTEFNFEPNSNSVAYLNSLVKAAAVLELAPQLLSIIAQRIVSELYQISEKCIAISSKERGVGASDGSIFVPVLKGNMDKIEAQEFYLFVPILKNLCSNLFGRFLTIANCIKIIGEATDSIVQDSGVPIDIFAFYRNCLSAIHGEVKNFIACLLHGSKLSRVFTSSIVAITEALKGKKPSSTIKTPIYQFVNLADARTLNGILDSSSILTRREVISARKLGTMLVVDPFSCSQQNVGHRLLVKPNLQYLAIIYRLFCQFDEWLKPIFTDEKPAIGEIRFVDAAFVETVLSEEYLPAIESYTLQELSRVFNSADALFWQEIIESDQTMAIGKGANCMLEGVNTFVGLLCQIACVLHQIPGSQAECEQLMTNLMGQFLEKCDSKFRELVTSKTTGGDIASIFIAISSQFVNNSTLRELLSQHSMLRNDTENEEFDEILAQKEILLLEKLKSDRSLHRNEIIFDHRILRSIALLHRSLELLPQILTNSDLGSVSSFPLHRPEFKKESTKTLVSHFFDGTTRGLITFSSGFEVQFTNFLSAIQKLSETCLFMLRIELRIHCFYYLDLAYREGNYDFSEASHEPDPYISSLANDLIRFESLMADWLPYSRYHVVMDELHQSLDGMLISDFRYIRALNPHGCHKLEMNVATLEQILSMISFGTAVNLEAGRQFYRLATAGPEKFIELAPNLSHKFTMQQYQSIFDVYYRDNSDDSGLRKTYNNQLIRLKYLLENQKDNGN